MAWMNTKSSPFGYIIAQGKYRELDQLFFRTLKQSMVLLLIGIGMFFSFLLYAARHYPKYASRVLTPWAFGFLLLGVVVNHILTSEALYLRAHKQEPFFVVSIVGAILIAISTYILSRYGNVNMVAVGYFFSGGVVGMIMGNYIFIKKRREWHSHNADIQQSALSQ